ncbi:immunoglobulin domain-containing protein [Streptomyces sp. NBC_01602]|uniref:immunoglobulin domain-containing protein n=1 Tax=Streptomyces sp. NBC_01602 TaxID=2975893 RepID=UPI00386F0896
MAVTAGTAVADPVGVPPSGRGGRVAAWGYNGSGQTDVPASLDGKTVTAIAAGQQHGLALTSEGKVTAWGNNDSGRTDVPASLAGETVTAIAAGEQHGLALTSEGKVTAWGNNGSGQTGVPASLAGKTVTAIAAGWYHSLALTSDGKVTAWGLNFGGQTDVPASLDGETVTAIAAGWRHSLALTSDGKVTGWGTNISGSTDVPASLAGKTVTAIAAGDGYSLAVVASTAPAVVEQPHDLTVNPGEDATFTATASGDPASTVQWQGRSGDNAPWVDIPGATTSTYTLAKATPADNGSQFRAVCTNPAGIATTQTATLTVNTPPVITGQPKDRTVNPGEDATFTATASGKPAPTVQWQRRSGDNAAWVDIPGATTGTYTLSKATSADNGSQFRAVFTNTAGKTATQSATLTVNTPPVITEQPENRRVNPGGDATFTAAASGKPAPTVQWQRRSGDNAAWTDIPGATTGTYTLSKATRADNRSQYRAVFTNTAGTATTQTATLTVTRHRPHHHRPHHHRPHHHR